MRKIIANIGWIFFDKIFRMLVGMLVSVWIARYLGPSEFGVLNYAIIFPAVFTAIAGFGLNNALLVEFVSTNGDLEKQHRLVQTGLFIKLVAGIGAYLMSCSLNYFLNTDKPLLSQMINIAGFVLILQSSDVIDTYFQSQTKAKLSITVKLISFGLASLLRVYALYTHRPVTFLLTINIIELIFVYFLALAVYQWKVYSVFRGISKLMSSQLIVQVIQISWPIMITELFVFVYMRVDQFMIESMSTTNELGLYGAALRLSETWYFVAGAVTTSLYPKIALSWPINKEKFYNQYQDLLNVLTYTSIILAFIVSLTANSLIEFIYGNDFSKAGIILNVHIWTSVFVFTGIGTNNLMIINNLQRFVLLKTVIGAVINILLNLWLIPKHGALGASVATLISQGMQAYGLNFLNHKTRFVFYMQSKSLVNLVTFKKPIMTQNWLLTNDYIQKV